jgi:transcriptional regulator with XRE-family HTH domain
MTAQQVDTHVPNYLRTHRKRIGLSQRELAEALGFYDESPVSRHERFESTPPLSIAIGYEVVFRVPVSEIFAGLRDRVEKDVENRLRDLQNALGERSAKDRGSTAVARKLMWLSERWDVADDSAP